jgi:hypothetical protein
MKKALSLGALIVLSLWLAGCASSKSLDGFHGGGGGGGGTTTGTLQSGNWAFTTSGGINGNLYLGGYLSSSGTNVTGNLYVLGTQGSGFLGSPSMTPMSVTGTLNSGTLTLTGAVSSSSFTITFTGLSSGGTITTLSAGSYSVTGGADNNDSGAINGVIAGDVSGSWNASENTTGGSVTVNITQAGSPVNGSYQLSATSGSGVTFTGAPGCTVTGTLKNGSFTAGGIVIMDISTVDNAVNGDVLFVGVATNPSSPTALSMVYSYTGGSGCLLQNNTSSPVNIAFAKQ